MTTKIWWVPAGSTTARELSLPIELSYVTQPEIVDDGSDVEAIGGRVAQVRLGSRLAFRCGLDALSYAAHASTIRELRAIEQHMQRGGWIALALDHSRAWAGIVSSELVTIPFVASEYPDETAYSYGWALPAVGAELWIGTPIPERLQQHIILDATDTAYPALLEVDAAAIYTFPVGSLVRDPDTWPRLVLRDRRSGILKGDDKRFVDVELDVIESHDVEVP